MSTRVEKLKPMPEGRNKEFFPVKGHTTKAQYPASKVQAAQVKDFYATFQKKYDNKRLASVQEG